MLRLTFAFMLVLGPAPHATAQPTPESRRQLSELQDELKALLEALRSEDYAVREKASDRLVAMGKLARSFLEGVRPELGIDTRLRVDAILARLGTETTRETGKLLATPVHVAFVEIPLLQAATKLCAIVGVKVRYGNQRPVVRPGQDPGPPPPPPPGSVVPVSYKAEGTPFFKALDEFCEIVGCSYHTDYATGDLILNPTTQKGTGPVVYAGPLRVAATSLSVTRQTRFVGPSTSNANLQVRIDVEPGAPVIGFISPVTGASAKDDKGNVISFRAWQGQRYLQNVARNRQLYQSLAMDPPAVDAKELLELAIPVEMVTPAEMVSGEITSLEAAPADATGEGPLRMKVDSVTTQNDQQVVTISFEAPPAQGPGDLRTLPTHEVIELWDLKGQPVTIQPNIARRAMNGRHVRTLRVPDVPLGRLRVSTMVRYRLLRQVVRFENLKLP